MERGGERVACSVAWLMSLARMLPPLPPLDTCLYVDRLFTTLVISLMSDEFDPMIGSVRLSRLYPSTCV